jgi:hypothetical protein
MWQQQCLSVPRGHEQSDKGWLSFYCCFAVMIRLALSAGSGVAKCGLQLVVPCLTSSCCRLQDKKRRQYLITALPETKVDLKGRFNYSVQQMCL